MSNSIDFSALDHYYGHTNAENINRFLDTLTGLMVCGNRPVKIHRRRRQAYPECEFKDCRDCQLAVRSEPEIHWAIRLDNEEMTEMRILVNRELEK